VGKREKTKEKVGIETEETRKRNKAKLELEAFFLRTAYTRTHMSKYTML
jgi:hypothetical protein